MNMLLADVTPAHVIAYVCERFRYNRAAKREKIVELVFLNCFFFFLENIFCQDGPFYITLVYIYILSVKVLVCIWN